MAYYWESFSYPYDDEYQRRVKKAIDRALENMRRTHPVDSGVLRSNTGGRRMSPVKPLESKAEAQAFHDEVAAFLKAQRP